MTIETARYILNNYSHLLEPSEKLFYKHAKSELILWRKTLGSILKQLKWVPDIEDTARFFQGEGYLGITSDDFDVLVASKLLERHKDEIFLNHCPRCGQLARTPRARQCRCGHSWRDGGIT